MDGRGRPPTKNTFLASCRAGACSRRSPLAARRGGARRNALRLHLFPSEKISFPEIFACRGGRPRPPENLPQRNGPSGGRPLRFLPRIFSCRAGAARARQERNALRFVLQVQPQKRLHLFPSEKISFLKFSRVGRNTGIAFRLASPVEKIPFVFFYTSFAVNGKQSDSFARIL